MPFERATNRALGELLVERGFLTSEQCEQALNYARQHGKRIGEALIEMGLISHDLLSAALGEQYGTRPMVIEPSMLDFDLLRRFPLDLLRRHNLLPLIDLGDELVVAVGDPNDREGIEALASLVPDRRLVFQLADAVEISRCLAHPQLAAKASSAGTEFVACSGSLARPENVCSLLFELLGREGVSAIGVRLRRDTKVEWWEEKNDHTSSLCHDAVLSLSLNEVQDFLSTCVKWLPYFEGKAGFLNLLTAAEEPRTIAVAASGDLNGRTCRFRLLQPLPDSVPLLDSAQCPENLVFILYESLEQITSLVQTLVNVSHYPSEALVVTERLPWQLGGALQFPVAGLELALVARSASVSRIIFDCPIPPFLISELTAAVPALSQLVIAVEMSHWMTYCEAVFPSVKKGFSVGIYRVSSEGKSLEELPSQNDEARA